MHFVAKWSLATCALAVLLQGSHLYGKIVGPDVHPDRMLRLQHEASFASAQTEPGWSYGMGEQLLLAAQSVEPRNASILAQNLSADVALNNTPNKPRSAPRKDADAKHEGAFQADSMQAIGYTGIDRFFKWRDNKGDWQYSVKRPSKGVSYEKIAVKPGENIIKSLPQAEIDRLLGRLNGDGNAWLPSWVADVFSVARERQSHCGAKTAQLALSDNVCVSKAKLYAAMSQALRSVN